MTQNYPSDFAHLTNEELDKLIADQKMLVDHLRSGPARGQPEAEAEARLRSAEGRLGDIEEERLRSCRLSG